jgi:hypothetical protein
MFDEHEKISLLCILSPSSPLHFVPAFQVPYSSFAVIKPSIPVLSSFSLICYDRSG